MTKHREATEVEKKEKEVLRQKKTQQYNAMKKMSKNPTHKNLVTYLNKTRERFKQV